MEGGGPECHLRSVIASLSVVAGLRQLPLIGPELSPDSKTIQAACNHATIGTVSRPVCLELIPALPALPPAGRRRGRQLSLEACSHGACTTRFPAGRLSVAHPAPPQSVSVSRQSCFHPFSPAIATADCSRHIVITRSPFPDQCLSASDNVNQRHPAPM